MSVIGRAAVERALVEQADLMARREGFKGQELADRRVELRRLATNEMAVRAADQGTQAAVDYISRQAGEYGRYMTLTSEKQAPLASVARAAQREAQRQGPVVGAVTRLAAPIVVVPGNFLARFVEYAGGLPKTIWNVQQLVRAIGRDAANVPELQKRVVDQFARGTLGAGLLWLGYTLAK